MCGYKTGSFNILETFMLNLSQTFSIKTHSYFWGTQSNLKRLLLIQNLNIQINKSFISSVKEVKITSNQCKEAYENEQAYSPCHVKQKPS